jgi:hypothetical protein
MKTQQKKQIVRFFSDKINTIPSDSYAVKWGDNETLFVIDNWLAMYPNGKVEFVMMDIP